MVIEMNKEIPVYGAWILPVCFTCSEAIVLDHGGYVLEFKCGCTKRRVETKQNYDIVSGEDVIMQTLYFNHALTKENLVWVGANRKRNVTMDLYKELRRAVILEEI